MPVMLLLEQYWSKSQWSSWSSFEEYPLQVRHKQDWGRGFIFSLPQTAALPEPVNDNVEVLGYFSKTV